MPGLLEDLKARFKPAYENRCQQVEEEGRRIIANLPKLLQRVADRGESKCVVHHTKMADRHTDPIIRMISDWADSQGLKVRTGILEDDDTFPVIVYGWR